jgi:hypothetical protein
MARIAITNTVAAIDCGAQGVFFISESWTKWGVCWDYLAPPGRLARR